MLAPATADPPQIFGAENISTFNTSNAPNINIKIKIVTIGPGNCIGKTGGKGATNGQGIEDHSAEVIPRGGSRRF